MNKSIVLVLLSLVLTSACTAQVESANAVEDTTEHSVVLAPDGSSVEEDAPAQPAAEPGRAIAAIAPACSSGDMARAQQDNRDKRGAFSVVTSCSYNSTGWIVYTYRSVTWSPGGGFN